MSTIRWLQRYSNCYSVFCSFICLPLWVIVLPIGFLFDICIHSITFLIFLIAFFLNILLAPCMLAYKFSSCFDACNVVNIYQYSLIKALPWYNTFLMIFQMFWLCYCGSSYIDDGAPI